MTKRTLFVCGVAIGALPVMGVWSALHYVPSPFASVELQGEAVVARLRPDLSFAVFRAPPVVEDISGSESLELRNGESVRLQSARRSYKVTGRTSPPPAGLYLEGEWHLHDFPKSCVKRWFVRAK